MRRFNVILIFGALTILGCSTKTDSPTNALPIAGSEARHADTTNHQGENHHDNRISDATMTKQDSLILSKYISQIGPQSSEEPSEDNDEVVKATVTYAPDSSFKIFVVELLGCGAYCNSSWYSWIHYNLRNEEVIKDNEHGPGFAAILNIHKLPDDKYLIVDESSGRPASVYTVSCMDATLISFRADSLIVHPILVQRQ